jgi:hypothetical protein
MRLNNKTQKFHNVIKYKAYTSLLEGRINKREHDILVELGFMDKVKSFFGGGMEVGGDLAKLFKDKVAQKQLQAAKENIGKAIADLKAIAQKAGVDESVVNEFLKGVLDEAGADPAEIAAAKPEGGGAEAGAAAETKPGTEVSAAAIEKNPAVAATIVADATGQPVEKVEAELEKKKPDVAAISAILGNAIGKSAGVDGKVVTDVIKTLIDKGHLKLENGNSLTRRGLMNFVNEVNELNNQYNLMERWSQLAGVNSVIISEGRSGDILKDIKSKKIKTPEELEARIKQATTDGQGGQVLKRKDEIMAAFKKVNPDVKPAEEKKIDTALEAAGKDAPPGGKEASPEDEKKAEEVKEKFSAAFKDVRAAIDPKKVDDTTLTKVIDAIDGFKSVAIAA